jgi:hypothetical protein
MKTDLQTDSSSPGASDQLNTIDEIITERNSVAKAGHYIGAIPPYPANFEGRGIVTCGGGKKHFTNAWVCINMLRWLGCKLPIELWYLGPRELDAKMAGLLEPLGVRCIDALEIRHQYPARILNGWESKPYAIIHSSFKEVLFLDADNVPVVDPTYLFETTPYQRTGAVLWPDFKDRTFQHRVWRAFGIEPRNEIQVESGQLLFDKSKCWKPLNLCMWYNEHSDFFYQYAYGDKDTFQMAWRKLNIEYAMPEILPIRSQGKAIYQHDFDGNKIFQHRNRDKWDLHRPHRLIPSFDHEEVCVTFLNALRSQWDGDINYKAFDSLISGTCERGSIEVNGTLGFQHRLGSSIFSTSDLREWNLISAHASSFIKINLEKPAIFKGFLNATATCDYNNPVEFWIDNNFIGRCNTGTDETCEVKVNAGVHQLEALCRRNNNKGRHSCWAVKHAIPNQHIQHTVATPTNVAVATLAIYPGRIGKEKLRMLAYSCRKFEIWLNVLYRESSEKYCHSKFKTRERYLWLKQLPEDFEYILFVDGADTLFCKPLSHFCSEYNAMNEEIVIGAENVSFPEGAKAWREQFPPHKENRRWINSGLFMGKRTAVISALERLYDLYQRLQGEDPTGLEDVWHLRKHTEQSEQILWQIAYIKGYFSIKMDSDCRLFANVTTQDLRLINNDAYDIKSGDLQLKSNGNRPSILHFSGSGYGFIQQWASFLGVIA